MSTPPEYKPMVFTLDDDNDAWKYCPNLEEALTSYNSAVARLSMVESDEEKGYNPYSSDDDDALPPSPPKLTRELTRFY